MARVAIIGRTSAMLNTGRLLISQGHEVPLVITAKEAPEYTVGSNDFKEFAQEIGATFIHTAKINTPENLELIASHAPLDIACSINYSGVIAQQVIDLFPLGILNAHAGDLPRYRGNAVLAWAIANMEIEIGLCVHNMIGGELDSGPIISRIYKDITDSTKVGELYNWMYEETPKLFLDSVDKLEKDSNYHLEIQSTDPKDILRCYPRMVEDGKIDWTLDAHTIVRNINASGDPFYGAFTMLKDKEIIVVNAEIVNDKEQWIGVAGQVCAISKYGYIDVLCGEGKLRINTIRESTNGDNMLPSDLIKSIRTRLR
jgi:UDP-4-amino-4-deoxy-L-arabinose formyltransferase/UDP-glucuronic acid dehydrogenase (UDP-4-keto-hexauronic acid decarboxylating)